MRPEESESCWTGVMLTSHPLASFVQGVTNKPEDVISLTAAPCSCQKKNPRSLTYVLGFVRPDVYNCCRYETFRWMNGCEAKVRLNVSLQSGRRLLFSPQRSMAPRLSANTSRKEHMKGTGVTHVCQAYRKVEKQSSTQNGLEQNQTWCSDTLSKKRHTPEIKLIIHGCVFAHTGQH